MLYRFLIYVRKPSNALWVVPSVGALLAVFIAFAASWVNAFAPAGSLPQIDKTTVESLLDVIASSMLAVSTFSLSIMVSAFASASSSATPRATDLVMGDDNTRMAIASFISAFIFAIIAKIALSVGYYGHNGLFALFISTILVLLYLIVTLIRWVHTLSQLGRLENTLSKIQSAAQQALLHYRKEPNMGATWQGELDAHAYPIVAGQSGYITHINMGTLQNHAEENDWYIHVAVCPGELVVSDTVLAYVNLQAEQYTKDYEKHPAASLVKCFVMDASRTYEQDPEWGVIVLSEAAQRALSPGINDPGTSIRVMSDLLSLFVDTRVNPEEAESNKDYDRLSIVERDCGAWIEEGFLPIARDGATSVEVGLVMQKVLAGIARNAPEKMMREAARRVATLSLERFEKSLVYDSDKERLRRKHEELFAETSE